MTTIPAETSQKPELREYQLRLQKLKLESPKLYWAKRYHRNTKGERLTFERSQFLVPIYKALDTMRRVIIPKSVQSGVSEMFIVSHLEEASRGLSILYVMPKSELRNTFVQNRINRVIQRVPHYKTTLRETMETAKADSIHIKAFGQGVIKYVDSNSASNFVEYPADAVYLDEKDQMNQQNIGMAPDRLVASKYKLERIVSNPSVENYGIDVDWQDSSQGIWLVQCPHCEERQPYDWFQNVVREIGERQYEPRYKGWDPLGQAPLQAVCRKCGKELSRFLSGEYVHRYPHRETKGFHINQLFGAQYMELGSLYDKFIKALNNDSKLQIFMNSVLGLPYTVKGSKITDADLDLCRVDGWYQQEGNTEGMVAMGVDVGTKLHVVIRKRMTDKQGQERRMVLWAGALRTEVELVGLARRYGVRIAVIDALPETRMVESLKTTLSFLYNCFFQESKYPTVNKKERILTLDRTTLLDEVKEQVFARVLGNYANMRDVPEYYSHLQANTRIYDPTAERFNWVQSANEDHLMLAEAYCAAAFKVQGSTDVLSFYTAMEEMKHKKEKDEGATEPPKGLTQQEVLSNISKRFYGG